MLRLWMYLQARMVRDEAGATMVEYGIMVALIAAVSIVIIGLIGVQILDAFTDVWSGLGGI